MLVKKWKERNPPLSVNLLELSDTFYEPSYMKVQNSVFL